eukprot:CAMPEP_0184871078 /NCGR_PEP_ID=MMETSP0580-20130426/39848_1 /TAXON_ID=1118495 /ORGANISM="Dactyliosolen fragilissimus" /LENGTH=182 /DNA_ID=CAMNT_0027373555 /DNA_START=66 /DNA_END=611 /DNA_ORIENTATION=-
MNSVSEWDEEYARLARAASQLRTFSPRQHPSARDQQAKSIKAGLSRLHSRLDSMELSGQIDSSDNARRKALVVSLVNQVGNQNTTGQGGGDTDLLGLSEGGSGGNRNNLSASARALRDQDVLIDELASGVGRLKDQTLLINDEANMQNRMLDTMEGDVEAARSGFEAETLRAMKLKEDKSVW